MDIPNSIQYRSIVAHTSLPGQLGFRSMSGSEGLSQLFEFDVELVADNHNVDLDALLGKPLTLEVETSAGSRYLNGQVARCEMIGRENGDSRHYIYKTTLRPWLWYLTQTSDNKIFQKKTAPDVIAEVLGEYGFPFEMKLNGSYRNWEYCVQYQETDFAFVSRLMEHEGIYYYFRHENGQHILVMVDDVISHDAASGYESIPYYGPDRVTTPQEEYISMWEIAAEITPDGYATVDYDFTKPGAMLDAVSRQSGGAQNVDLEMFEWQGGFQEPEHGEQYSKIRLEELQSRRKQNRGLATARWIAPGYRFTLKNHPRAAENKEYLTVSVSYRASVGGYAMDSGSDFQWETSFVVLPTSLQYRAPRNTPVPRTYGPQTARVVGPAGEEIWTDEYGRIKVQFHWDRYGKKNENSSCWVRVSSPWAGGGFGGLQLPRINDEVVVDFIGGCPDRPLVLGRVYNANNMPPVDLPAGATQSGFRSQSVHGDPSMSNRMLFDDKLGAELLLLRAQRNMNCEVINDHDHTVGVNHRHNVGVNFDQTIGSNCTTDIGGNLKTTIAQIEERLVQAEQKLEVLGDATQEFQSNFSKTIQGNEERNTTGTQTITVEGESTHTYNSNLTQNVNADHKVNVTGNQDTKVDGDVTVKAKSHTVSVDSNWYDFTWGNSTSFTGGSSFTVFAGLSASATATSLSATGVSTSLTGLSMSLTGASFSMLGKTIRTRGQAAEVNAAKQKMTAIENSIGVVRSRTAALARITRGVKMAQSGMSQDINGLKNNVSSLDNRVSALENHA